MNAYLNPGNMPFFMARNSEIYIDKSGLLARLNRLINTKQRFVCVSRPRRFGKTMAAEMLAAYYSRGCDSAELFRDLRIAHDASYEAHLNRYNTIFINILSPMIW
jgi:predicted AAA+ superfamily ATPase